MNKILLYSIIIFVNIISPISSSASKHYFKNSNKNRICYFQDKEEIILGMNDLIIPTILNSYQNTKTGKTIIFGVLFCSEGIEKFPVKVEVIKNVDFKMLCHNNNNQEGICFTFGKSDLLKLGYTSELYTYLNNDFLFSITVEENDIFIFTIENANPLYLYLKPR
jgi:hypothetical protein